MSGQHLERRQRSGGFTSLGFGRPAADVLPSPPAVEWKGLKTAPLQVSCPPGMDASRFELVHSSRFEVGDKWALRAAKSLPLMLHFSSSKHQSTMKARIVLRPETVKTVNKGNTAKNKPFSKGRVGAVRLRSLDGAHPLWAQVCVRAVGAPEATLPGNDFLLYRSAAQNDARAGYDAKGKADPHFKVVSNARVAYELKVWAERDGSWVVDGEGVVAPAQSDVQPPWHQFTLCLDGREVMSQDAAPTKKQVAAWRYECKKEHCRLVRQQQRANQRAASSKAKIAAGRSSSKRGSKGNKTAVSLSHVQAPSSVRPHKPWRRVAPSEAPAGLAGLRVQLPSAAASAPLTESHSQQGLKLPSPMPPPLGFGLKVVLSPVPPAPHISLSWTPTGFGSCTPTLSNSHGNDSYLFNLGGSEGSTPQSFLSPKGWLAGNNTPRSFSPNELFGFSTNNPGGGIGGLSPKTISNSHPLIFASPLETPNSVKMVVMGYPPAAPAS